MITSTDPLFVGQQFLQQPGQPIGDDVFDDLDEECDLGGTAPLQVSAEHTNTVT